MRIEYFTCAIFSFGNWKLGYILRKVLICSLLATVSLMKCSVVPTLGSCQVIFNIDLSLAHIPSHYCPRITVSATAPTTDDVTVPADNTTLSSSQSGDDLDFSVQVTSRLSPTMFLNSAVEAFYNQCSLLEVYALTLCSSGHRIGYQTNNDNDVIVIIAM